MQQQQICGLKKEMVSLAMWHGEKMDRLLPDSRLEVVAEATHGLPLHRPEIVAQLVDNFLA